MESGPFGPPSQTMWSTWTISCSQEIKFLSLYIIPISVDDVNIVNDPLCSLSYHANPRIFKNLTNREKFFRFLGNSDRVSLFGGFLARLIP